MTKTEIKKRHQLINSKFLLEIYISLRPVFNEKAKQDMKCNILFWQKNSRTRWTLFVARSKSNDSHTHTYTHMTEQRKHLTASPLAVQQTVCAENIIYNHYLLSAGQYLLPNHSRAFAVSGSAFPRFCCSPLPVAGMMYGFCCRFVLLLPLPPLSAFCFLFLPPA